ncbi:hypothetical protein AL486_18875 [Pandoraea apista]|uniref:hypothetical protein n=1 Tax=Pandoraea apista TaxID=93218 RepID=UPI000CE97342|nr:hypothetical protein [Pandoraea apista]AVF41528.1 hypothetical protein AL486_18875 [Pandoraea apista]
MDTWVNQLHARASIVHGQIAASLSIIRSLDSESSKLIDQEVALRPLYDLLRKLYAEDLPLAKVRDTSDIVIHAEGPAAVGEAMQLRAVNWLSAKVKQQLTLLAAAALPQNGDTSVIARKFQWNVTGLVPGSIFMGFALDRPAMESPFEMTDNIAFDAIVTAAQAIPVVPRFVDDNGVAPELLDELDDPAVRDAAMFAAMRLAPTDSSGLVTVEISAPTGEHGVLGQRERIVLRESLRSPLMRKKIEGTFVGEVREVDLDAGRFQLRGVQGVGTLRCAMPFNNEQAAGWLGKGVKVSGVYETDHNGRPRLMRVESIDVVRQLNLI